MKLNRILLSSSILLNTLFSNAQTNIQENQSKISIGLTQSIDLGYRFSSANSASFWMKNISDSIERPILANSSAVKFQFDLNKKITLRTGIVFSQKGYQYRSGTLAGFDLYKEHFSFIEVPVQVLYKFGQKKNIPYISIGTSAGYLIESQAVYSLENSAKEAKMDLTSDLSKFQINGILGLGMSFSLNQKWNLISELNYSQALYSISSGPIKKQLFTAGINIGLFRYF
jgi:hypothetical protein